MRSFLPVLALLTAACATGDASGTSFGGFSAGPGGGMSSGDTGDTHGTAGGSEGSTDGTSGSNGTAAATSESTTDSASSGGTAECGDGILQPGENCEALEFGGKTCADFGFSAGDLICSNDCKILTDGCFTCGDGTKQAAEQCDGQDFGGKTCLTEGFAGGTLQCSADCQTIQTSGCQQAPTCGDGVRNGNEQCDGNDLGGQSCASQGFDGGSLSCNANCTFNTSQCQTNPNCAGAGDFCLSDEECCPPGQQGIILQSCQLFLCV